MAIIDLLRAGAGVAGITATPITPIGLPPLTATNHIYQGVAINADASMIFVTHGWPGYSYISTDSGTTWTPVTSVGKIAALGCSSTTDGKTLLTADATYHLNRSIDGGITWAHNTLSPKLYWRNIKSNGDGDIIIGAIVNGGGYVISRDSGDSWANIIIPGLDTTKYAAYSVAISADSSTIVAGFGAKGGSWGSGCIYLSRDSGTTWNQITSLPSATYTSVAVSGDGSVIVVESSLQYGPDKVYISNDFGENWTRQPRHLSTGGRTTDMVLALDGTKLYSHQNYNNYITVHQI